MKVADFLFNSFMSKQKPIADLLNKSLDSPDQGTHKSIKYFE